MKILLLGDVSHYHSSLAAGLRRLGHDVTLAGDGGGWMQTARDIDLSRSHTRLGGAWLWLKLNTLLAPDLKGYDVVQLCSPWFIHLRPERLLKIFKRLKRDNGRVFLTDLGNSPHYVEMCLSDNSPLKYNEWRNPDFHFPPDSPRAKAWLTDEMRAYCNEIYTGTDGVMTALYEYHLADRGIVDSHRLHYVGIPIDLQALPLPSKRQGPVKILSAFDANRADLKGAGILRDMARRLVVGHPGKAELREVSNLPYHQFVEAVAASDIVLDQLYSYTPATTALMAMAMGAVAVSGGEEDYYSFISEQEMRPIVNASPFDLKQAENELEHLITDPSALKQRQELSREFAETYHSADSLALRFLDIWTSY